MHPVHARRVGVAAIAAENVTLWALVTIAAVRFTVMDGPAAGAAPATGVLLSAAVMVPLLLALDRLPASRQLAVVGSAAVLARLPLLAAVLAGTSRLVTVACFAAAVSLSYGANVLTKRHLVAPDGHRAWTGRSATAGLAGGAAGGVVGGWAAATFVDASGAPADTTVIVAGLVMVAGTVLYPFGAHHAGTGRLVRADPRGILGVFATWRTWGPWIGLWVLVAPVAVWALPLAVDRAGPGWAVPVRLGGAVAALAVPALAARTARLPWTVAGAGMAVGLLAVAWAAGPVLAAVLAVAATGANKLLSGLTQSTAESELVRGGASSGQLAVLTAVRSGSGGLVTLLVG